MYYYSIKIHSPLSDEYFHSFEMPDIDLKTNFRCQYNAKHSLCKNYNFDFTSQIPQCYSLLSTVCLLLKCPSNKSYLFLKKKLQFWSNNKFSSENINITPSK